MCRQSIFIDERSHTFNLQSHRFQQSVIMIRPNSRSFLFCSSRLLRLSTVRCRSLSLSETLVRSRNWDLPSANQRMRLRITRWSVTSCTLSAQLRNVYCC